MHASFQQIIMHACSFNKFLERSITTVLLCTFFFIAKQLLITVIDVQWHVYFYFYSPQYIQQSLSKLCIHVVIQICVTFLKEESMTFDMHKTIKRQFVLGPVQVLREAIGEDTGF